MGKGGAILQGMNMSGGDIVGFVDADGSLSSEDLRKIILSVDDRSFVFASRYGKDSVWLKKEPLFNRMASRAFNFLVNSVLHLNVKDTQCGAKFMSKSVAKEILRQINVRNRTFDVSMIYHAKKSKAKILETPVTWKHDENSRLPIGHAILPMFLTILGIRFMNSRYSHRVPSWVFKVLSKFRFY